MIYFTNLVNGEEEYMLLESFKSSINEVEDYMQEISEPTIEMNKLL